MLERSLLESVNGLMIGRGAPVEVDNSGYNVPDYNKLSSIWNGATNNDLYEIASRLLKYYDSQLANFVDFSKEDLVDSIDYYKKLSEEGINKLSVTIGFTSDYKNVHVGFKYNNDYINIMRKFKYSFDRDTKSWKGDSLYIKTILKVLGEIGADIENALMYITEVEEENNISFSESIDKDREEVHKKDIIFVKEVDEDNISLKFEFNNDIVNEIKRLKSKKFDWDSKIWIINKFEGKTLYENISHLGYDLTELTPFIEGLSIPKLKVVRVNNLDIELSFPYIPEVVDAIKSLTFYKFNRPQITWTIDLREKDILVEMVEKSIDCTELNEIEVLENKETVPLKDYSYLDRKPFKHQIEAAEFLLCKRKAIIGDEMGSGKTMSSILASYSLNSPRLIICPASLKLNWAKEIRMIDNNGRICIISDKGITDADWYIINYDILERDYDKLRKIPFSSITLDEAHYIKSVSNSGEANSKRAKYSLKLADKCAYVFSLTGTPITNKPKDIFNILKISDHILAKNFFSFAQQFCGAEHNGFGWSFEGSSNEDILHEKIKPIMLRRLKKNMLDLPEKIRRFIPVEINMNKYLKAVEKYMAEKSSITDIGGHLVYLTTIKHILAKEKVKSTIEIAENILSSDESVVIFTNYNGVVDKLMNHFGEIATKITGSCNAQARQNAVDDFQSGKKKVMVANIIAGGVGITLIKANNLIFNDFDWVPANHFQAEDRIHRIGQQNNCNINYVYVNGAEIDEYMSVILEKKSTYINKIIDGGEGDQLDIVKEMIQNLYKVA